MRVHELAKQLGIESKVLISRLNRIDIAITSHSNTLSEDDLQKALAAFGSTESSNVVTAKGKLGRGAKLTKKPSGRTVKGQEEPAEPAPSPKPEKKHILIKKKREEVEALLPPMEIQEASVQEAQPSTQDRGHNKNSDVD